MDDVHPLLNGAVPQPIVAVVQLVTVPQQTVAVFQLVTVLRPTVETLFKDEQDYKQSFNLNISVI